MKKRIISFMLVSVMVIAILPFITVNSVASDVIDTQANSRVMEKVDRATLDGVNTDGEYDSARRVFLNGAGNDLALADIGDIMRVVYTDEAIYILVEVVDSTINNFADGADEYDFDLIELYFSIGNTFLGSSCFYRGGTNEKNENSVFNETEFGFSVEMRFPVSQLSDAERRAYSKRTLAVAFSAQARDGETKTWRGDIDNSEFYYEDSYASSLPSYKFSYHDASYKNYMIYDPTPVLDGRNTGGEYNEAYVNHIDKFGSGVTDTDGDIFRIVYSDEAIYVLIESSDDTDDGLRDYIDFYFRIGTTYVGRKQVYRTDACGANQSYGGEFSFGELWEHNTEYFVHTSNGEGFSLEAKFPVSNMNSTDRMAYKLGLLDVGFSVCIKNSSAYRTDHQNNAQFSEGKAHVSQYPKFTFDRSRSITPRLFGANLSLDEHIKLNYIVNLSDEDADNALMVFIYNEKELVIKPEKISNGRYKFVFELEGPQSLCKKIDATFFVNGKIFATKSDYSVVDYCKNLLGTNGEVLDQLIYDFLAYGAESQLYVNEDTDNLANAGYEDMATVVEKIENDDRVVGAANVAGAKFSAIGVYHYNTNQIYAKIAVNGEDENSLEITVNGVKANIEKSGVEDILIVFTEDISVIDFDKIYKFELTDGSNVQTLTYSVNAYAKSKLENSSPDEITNLAKALYAYGVSAENYMAHLLYQN